MNISQLFKTFQFSSIQQCWAHFFHKFYSFFLLYEFQQLLLVVTISFDFSYSFVNQQITRRVEFFFFIFIPSIHVLALLNWKEKQKKCETLLWMHGTSTAKHNSVSFEMIGNLLMILYCLSFFFSFFCFSHSTLYIAIHFERVNFINAQCNHWFFACNIIIIASYTMKS